MAERQQVRIQFKVSPALSQTTKCPRTRHVCGHACNRFKGSARWCCQRPFCLAMRNAALPTHGHIKLC